MTDKDLLTHPIVHLNGSGKTNLLAFYKNAVNSLALAIDDLKHTAPHGRDYYVYPYAPTLNKANSEHLSRLERLESVYAELLELEGRLEET
jgi:hypothetical protein